MIEKLIADLEAEAEHYLRMSRDSSAPMQPYFLGKLNAFRVAIDFVKQAADDRKPGRYLPSRHPNAVKH